MQQLLEAIELVSKYNRMPLRDVVKEFEQYSKQKISEKVVADFLFTGLTAVDFLTSDYLNQHGLKNLYQVNDL